MVIELVKHCKYVRILSLFGYEDLSDIVLQYLSGEHEASPGLTLLETLTLPDRSFVTEHGVRSLLQHLQYLHTVNFPGTEKI